MQYQKVRWIALVVLLFSATLFAQEFTGRVTDSKGAVLPKAAITVHSQLTNVDIKTVTTNTGNYTVPYLKPGLYTITALAAGFDEQSQTDITLQVGQTATINFVMKIGTVAETVTVSSTAILDEGKADVGEVIENTRVTELPLDGGDISQLALLSTGAEGGNPMWIRPFDSTLATVSINGGGAANNALLLDGVSNEAARGDAYNSVNSQQGYIAPIDAVQEFKIITNPYDAQFGRASGGVIDMTLKSGTNKLHGAVYEYGRRSWLDSNDWVSNHNGTPIAVQKRDQYGAEMDGPLFVPKVYNGHDKTFVLLQFENWKSTEPHTAVGSVPDPAWLTGDFSKATYYDATKTKSQQPLTIYDPLTIHADGTRDKFPGNIIPANRISKFTQKLLSYYPKPNLPSTVGLNPWTNNFTAPSPIQDVYRNALVKIDQNVSDHDRFSLRYGYWERSETQNQNGIPGAGAQGEYPHGERSHTFATDWTHTFTPNLLFDFKSSMIVRANIAGGGPLGFDLSSLGLPSSLISQLGIFSHSLPSTSMSEFSGIGNSGGAITIGDSLAMLPSVTYIKGQHTLHIGFDWRILQSSSRTSPGGMSIYSDRTWTQAIYNQYDQSSGNSIASLLLGTAVNSKDQTYADINPTVFWSQHYYAPFIQDDWKVLPKLTLNLGLRYDLNGPPVERHNRADYAFDTAITNPVNWQVSPTLLNGPLMGGLTFLGTNGNPRAYNAVVKTNIQPRLGFSYALTEKTVLHGGFGVMFKNPAPGANQTGFSARTQYDASDDGMLTPTQNLLGDATHPINPFPSIVQPQGAALGALTNLGQGLYYLNPKFRTPKTYTYSFGVQRQFFKNDTIEINYVGTRTHHLDSSDNINHPSASSYARCNLDLGGDPANCAANGTGNVTNPFYNVAAFNGSGAYYSSKTIQALNLTRPFPEFSDVTEYDINDAKTWYNSLQLTAMHKFGQSLTLHGTWTWSKMMDSGGWVDTIYRIGSRQVDSGDATHRITVSGVWTLPVGRGHLLLPRANRVVDAAIGGWELGSSFVLQTGSPWTLDGNTRYYGGAKLSKHSDPSIANSIRGVKACVGKWAQPTQSDGSLGPWAIVPANGDCTSNFNFVVVPNYGVHPNVVDTGIRNPGWTNLDANLSKNFTITETLRAQLRLEAFNVPNHPAWARNYDNGPTNASFGTIVKESVGQTNLPRQVQLGIKLLW